MRRKPEILVAGSFVMDQIATTAVFPKEGQTVMGKSFQKAPGGKGANQAVQAARLGADVTMFGKLGRDANAQELLATCREAGINTEYVVFDEEAPSACSMIILEEMPGQPTRNRIIVLPGANMKIRPGDVEFLKDKIGEYDLVMLQLEIPMEINEIVAQYAYDKGVPVMLNPAPSAPLSDKLLSHLTFLSPNEHEAEDLTGIHIAHDGNSVDMDSVKAAAAALRRRGVKNVLITLGTAGAALDNKDGFFHSPCVEEVKAVDPTAAGDSFVASFCVGTCCRWSWEDCLLFSNYAAALTVSKMGAMPSLPGLGQVEDLLWKLGGRKMDTADLNG